MNFAENLKYLRNSKQLAQKELALYLGLSANCICEWEKNRSEPSISTIKNLAELFEVSADYLLGLEDDFGTKLTLSNEHYSSEERKLVENFRELNSAGKKLVNETIKTLLTTSGRSEKNKIS